MLALPGNPGQVDYFRDFLDDLHGMHPDLAIVAKAHLGHTPEYCMVPSEKHTGLHVQVESALEMVDVLKKTYPGARLAVAGHSVGAWITTQVRETYHLI